MEVQLISRKLIKPSVQTPSHLQNLNISFLDQLAPSLYVANIFYYPNHHHEIIKNIDRLVKSLSEILTLFYPLAGRYIKDNLSVDCNDEGVELLEAKVDGVDLTQIFQQDPNSNLELLAHFVPCISDRITISTSINAWATTFREGGISDQVPRPRFYCSFLFPQRDLRLNLPPAPKVHSKIVTKVFVINKEAIDKLKSKISGGSDSGVKYHPSRLEVVTTLGWKALIGSAKAQRGHLRASSLLQIMTLRGKVSMPLPENACGNMYMPFISRFSTYDKNNKLKLTDIVSLLRDAKRKAMSDCTNAINSNDVFSMDNKSGDGIEAWMNLKEIDMLHFQQDPDILALTSSQE
ncbi:acetyl-CoA-benzylalcohol acetyltransferase-like [Populus nigra]|uniref:acetyl-CoA-benzylalcohol acetyltransferase-like n=1 Tax=Populus nigra TaxID=3691 RepID=UPI002B26D794|nr:acetyl-CoA-benzylalcohol acetyltransferase-like [Populus nigra]